MTIQQAKELQRRFASEVRADLKELARLRVAGAARVLRTMPDDLSEYADSMSVRECADLLCLLAS
jgi:hypothetical protein